MGGTRQKFFTCLPPARILHPPKYVKARNVPADRCMSVILSDLDRDLLGGRHGPAASFAMTLLVRFAEAIGASKFVLRGGLCRGSASGQGNTTISTQLGFLPIA